MTVRLKRFAPLAALLVCLAGPADAAKQVVALFPPETTEIGADNVLRPAIPVLEQTLTQKLEDRFDIRPAGALPVVPAPDEQRRRKARSLGASYILSGNLSRIGKAVTLDLTIAPAEEPAKGRTVVVTGALDDPSPVSPAYGSLFRSLGTEAALKMKQLFFGDERVGEGPAAKKIPKLLGTTARSAPMPGDMVSLAASDLDLDGKVEIVAAYPDAIVVYRVEGDDLREKARIQNAGPGLIHVDAADVTRNGVADIVATRFADGKARSDIWQFDGKEYRKVSAGLPFFLRVADLGPEGIVLLGQESDPDKGYRGPIFRFAVNRNGLAELKDRDRPLPLPDGVFLYGFASLRYAKGVRYAVLTGRDRLVYLDGAGKELWEGLDAVTGSEVALETRVLRVPMPPRMVGVDLDRDGNDELVVLNDLVAAGTYFENLRVRSQAELLCFAQGEGSLQLAWRSPQNEASARDLVADRSAPRAVRFALASRDRGKLVGGASQWQVLWLK
jgi:hypothetical protein